MSKQNNIPSYFTISPKCLKINEENHDKKIGWKKVSKSVWKVVTCAIFLKWKSWHTYK